MSQGKKRLHKLNPLLFCINQSMYENFNMILISLDCHAQCKLTGWFCWYGQRGAGVRTAVTICCYAHELPLVRLAPIVIPVCSDSQRVVILDNDLVLLLIQPVSVQIPLHSGWCRVIGVRLTAEHNIIVPFQLKVLWCPSDDSGVWKTVTTVSEGGISLHHYTAEGRKIRLLSWHW